MTERAGDARLALETGPQALVRGQIAVHDLERHVAFHAQLMRAVHTAHRARADQEIDAKLAAQYLAEVRVWALVDAASSQRVAVAWTDNHALGVAFPTARAATLGLAHCPASLACRWAAARKRWASWLVGGRFCQPF